MAIRLDRVSKSYGDLCVIRDMTYVFPERGVVAITGRSASGKTTLINLLLCIVKPDSGTITGAGRIGAVFQEDRLASNLTVSGNLRLINADRAAIDRHLKAVGLYENRDDAIDSLSGGMKRRLAVARAVLYPSEATVMDEPYKGLDGKTREQVIAYVLRECANRLIVCVSHEPEELRLMKPMDIINLGE